jgi:hypothetical protein
MGVIEYAALEVDKLVEEDEAFALRIENMAREGVAGGVAR